MAFQTRFANCASTVATWLTVRDTVAVDTLARLATSRMSTRPLLPSAKIVGHSIRYLKPLTNLSPAGGIFLGTRTIRNRFLSGKAIKRAQNLTRRRCQAEKHPHRRPLQCQEGRGKRLPNHALSQWCILVLLEDHHD